MNWPVQNDAVKTAGLAKLDDPISDAMRQRLEKERLPATPDGILMLWQRTQKILADAKLDEMDIRKTAVKVYVPQPKEGMNNVDLGQGYVLKAGVKFNYTLDPDNAKVEAALDDISTMGNEGAFLAERLVKWQASFLLTEYRPLCDDDATDIQKKIKKRIEQVLTITDAAPTLEIKEPKSKK